MKLLKYFRDIYSGANAKWYRNSWVEFKELGGINNRYSSNYYDVTINKYGVKCGTSLRFCENKGWIDSMDPYGWVQWYFRYWFDRRSNDNERQIARWNDIVSRFKDRLVNMIKDISGRFDDYTFSPIIRQVLLHWGYESLK